MVYIMTAKKVLTRDDLGRIRGDLLTLSSELKRFRRKMRRNPEMTNEITEELRNDQIKIDTAIRDINLCLFDSIISDIDQPKAKLLMSIQKVNAKIRAVEQVNKGIAKVVQILKPFTTMLAMIASPGGALSVVGIARLISEIEAVA